ncbi:MAG: tetratricopeptide repeat protein [Salinivirgaceae bacterium]|nr:tetratricopeptide repeat protein [Salinivirgaceae bacterium]
MRKSLSYLYKLFCIILLSLFFTNSAQAQSKKLPEQVQIQIDNYKNNAFKNRNIGNDNAAATYLNKIAYLYWEYFIYDEAVNYFEQVLQINESLGNNIGVQKVLDNIGFVYSDMGRHDKAIEYFTKSLEKLNLTKNKKQIATGISNVALAYTNNGQSDMAIEKALMGLEISKNIQDFKLMRSFYGILYESYEKKGDKDKSVKYFGLYSSIDKHIQRQLFNEKEKQNNQRMSEMKNQKDKAVQEKELKEVELVKTQDNLKKSQLEIDLLNAENIAKEANLKAQKAQLKANEEKQKAQRRLIYFISAVFVFLCVFSFLIFRQMQEKKKANKKLQELYSEIEKKNIQILDSINYASHIQEAILPYEKQLKEKLENAFILFKPRDIVSGDFYWHSYYEDKVFIAAIDCTGHGVPGAFMSMIGNTLLNEIVNEKKIHNPAEVLKQLNDKVKFTLNQDNPDSEGFSEDGMDITFCCYSEKDNTLELAMANHSICIIQNGELQIVEGDIFSVGGNVGFSDISFSNYKINLDTETTVYMYSDGFQDQFGGEKQQKYMSTRFVNFFQSLQDKPFNEHQSILENEFLSWKGDSKQIDDVLIIGLRFNA